MTTSNAKTNQPTISRRRMLTRLGLTATALYAAPVMLQLSNARASDFTGASVTRPSYSRPSFSRGVRRGRSAARGRRRHRQVKSFSS
jgi:hypothetical protein